VVETLVIKQEKEEEALEWRKKLDEYIKKHPELYKEVKSQKVFAQLFGGTLGGYVEMLEFESLADVEKFLNKVNQDEEFLTTIVSEALNFIVPGTRSLSVWAPVQ